MAGFESKSRQRPRNRVSRSPFCPSASISMYFPILTLRTSGIPRWRIASRTALPCGSSTAAFGMTRTFTFIVSPYLRLTARTSGFRDSGFTDDLIWLFIFAQTQKNWRAELSVAGPFREFDFAYQDRIYPMHFAHYRWRDSLHPFSVLLRRKVDKGAIVALFLSEFLMQHGQ